MKSAQDISGHLPVPKPPGLSPSLHSPMRNVSPRLGIRAPESCSSSPICTGFSTRCSSNDAVHLNWLREEAEWEKCSLNPSVARYVKTRNIIERNRLNAVHLLLDRELERELKRIAIERREFADVFDNIKQRRMKSQERNVRRGQRLRTSSGDYPCHSESNFVNPVAGKWQPVPSQPWSPHISPGSIPHGWDRVRPNHDLMGTVMSSPDLHRPRRPESGSQLDSSVKANLSDYSSSLPRSNQKDGASRFSNNTKRFIVNKTSSNPSPSTGLDIQYTEAGKANEP
ncbi:hypothetical protein CRM22_001788 [Opisthorchis felineus]|uniref:Uncharacterized protein n=1 Tax=Opisthorchis felineus TaxID=147828 RepID=A0A4S2M972_OPIFE|nr:hypothetical protein CRM22_001788 [Opisthorchis felineus]